MNQKLIKIKMANVKTASLYGGKVHIDFYPDSHRYKKQGESNYLISVTTACGMLDKSRVLIKWATGLAKDFLLGQLKDIAKTTNEEIIQGLIERACGLHEERKQKAADIGTQVHEWAEKHIAGEKPPLPKDKNVLNGVMAFLKWLEENKIKFIASEKLVYSKKYDYVGLMDAAAIIKSKRYVIDF